MQIDFEAVLDTMFGHAGLFGDYRPEQHELALREWRHAHFRYPNSPFAPNMIQEAAPGIGKTEVELAVAFLLALEGDLLNQSQRSVIAVHTIALREQIRSRNGVVQAVIAEAFSILGYEPPREIVVRSLESPTQYISPMRVESYKAWVANSSLSAADRRDWNAFYSSYNNLYTMNGGLVPIHDWYAESDGKPLPLELGTLNVCLDDDDIDLMRQVIEAQRASYKADVLICTHTSLNHLSWRLRYFDAIESRNGAGDYIKNDCGAYMLLIVDEAHNLPRTTHNAIDETMQLNVLRELFDNAPAKINTLPLLDAFAVMENYVTETVGVERRVPIDAPDAYNKFHVRAIDPFVSALNDLYIEHQDHDPLFTARMESILYAFEPMVRQHDLAGTTDVRYLDISNTDAYPVLTRRGNEYTIKFETGWMGRKLASLWRRGPDRPHKRMFESVIMISGTVADADPDHGDPYQYFRKQIGATRVGALRDAVWYGSPLPAIHVGAAIGVMFADRSIDLLPHVMVAGEPMINQKHIDYLVGMIALAFDQKRPDAANRLLVLFMSEQALSAACDALAAQDQQRAKKRLPPILPHLIAQHSGMHFVGNPSALFQADARAVLFSMNWQGINVVDSSGRSIVDQLILAKLPFPPANERMMYEVSGVAAIRTIFEEAVWYFRQGEGRAMRDQSARFKLWICDARMPLPNELVAFGYPKYCRRRDASSRGNLYRLFDRLITPALFGQYGSALFATPIILGYVAADLTCTEHRVIMGME